MLTRLKLENFRSHVETSLEWDSAVNYICGPNGGGKSSIQMAVQMLFLDRCLVTGGNGQYKEALIRTGANDYILTGELDSREGEKSSKIEKRRKSAVGLGATTLTDVNKSVLDYLSTNSAAVNIVTGGSFFDMPDNDQRGMLMTLAGVDCSEESIREYLSRELGEVYTQIGEQLDGLRLGEGSVAVDACETYLVNARKIAKKDRDEAESNMKTHASGDLDGIDPKEAASVGERLRNNLATAREKFSGVSAESAASAEQLTRVKSDIESLESQIKEVRVPADVDEAMKKAKARFDKAEDIRTRSEKEFGELTGRRKQNELEIEKAERLGTADCPTCGQSIDAAKTAERLAAVKEDNDKIMARLGVVKEANAKARDEAVTSGERYKILKKYQDELEPRMAELLQRKETLETESRVSGKVDVTSLQEEITSTEARLEDWQKTYGVKLESAGVFLQAKGIFEREEAKASALEAAVTSIRRFRSVAVENKLSIFSKHLNDAAGEIGMKFSIDPSTLMVTTSSGLAYRSLSESEQVRIDTCFRLIISELTGLRFIVVDRADVLDKANRIAMLKLILKSKQKALILAKSEDRESFSPKVNPRIKYFWVAKNSEGISSMESVA